LYGGVSDCPNDSPQRGVENQRAAGARTHGRHRKPVFSRTVALAAELLTRSRPEVDEKDASLELIGDDGALARQLPNTGDHRERLGNHRVALSSQVDL
jgi:hypothetical protein